MIKVLISTTTNNQSKTAQKTLNNQSKLSSNHPNNILGTMPKLGTNAFAKSAGATFDQSAGHRNLLN